jgi:4-hydroxy-3-methylbut-2-enyl diphosphate reductase IspH
VGLTAGTSTPASVIDEVERWLQDFAQFQSELQQHAPEDAA